MNYIIVGARYMFLFYFFKLHCLLGVFGEVVGCMSLFFLQ